MKKLIGYIAVFAMLLGTMVVASSDAAVVRPRNIDYGSGVWAGPGSGSVQDPGWADPDLQVGMVGDSIAFTCQHELRAAFAAEGVTFALRAHSGQNTAGSLDWYDSLSYLPDKTIFELGTNDVFNPFAMPVQIERAKALSGLAEVFWIDTYVGRPTTTTHKIEDDIRNSGQVNDYIHAAIPADHVIDWNANLTSTRGRGLSIQYYVPDGVHPQKNPPPGSGNGCANYTAVVMNTVRPLL